MQTLCELSDREQEWCLSTLRPILRLLYPEICLMIREPWSHISEQQHKELYQLVNGKGSPVPGMVHWRHSRPVPCVHGTEMCTASSNHPTLQMAPLCTSLFLNFNSFLLFDLALSLPTPLFSLFNCTGVLKFWTWWLRFSTSLSAW